MYNTKYRKRLKDHDNKELKTKGHHMLELDYETTTTTDERILELDKIIFG
jgi:hypothetical protein